MYLIENKGEAIACMILALFLLGSVPAIFNRLDRRGRLPQHSYLDFSVTNFLAAVIIAFTLGQIGLRKPNFIHQLSQDNWPSALFAICGGVTLSIGNMAMQYALAFAGLSVSEVIASSIIVVIGATSNYFLDGRINRADMLFPGVAIFFAAVCLGSALHSSNAADNKAKLDSHASLKLDESADQEQQSGESSGVKAEGGTAKYILQVEDQRAIKVLQKGTSFGLIIPIFAGLTLSLFIPAVNLAINDQWHRLKKGVPHLTVYTAYFYFSISCFFIDIIANITFLYFPLFNLPKSSLKAYLSDWRGRGWALLAGLFCGFANGLQFMGGQAAGYAAASAVQAFPLVNTFWGILVFGEYRRSSRRTYTLLVAMLLMFILAVAVLIASSGHRKLNARA